MKSSLAPGLYVKTTGRLHTCSLAQETKTNRILTTDDLKVGYRLFFAIFGEHALIIK